MSNVTKGFIARLTTTGEYLTDVCPLAWTTDIDKAKVYVYAGGAVDAIARSANIPRETVKIYPVRATTIVSIIPPEDESL